MRLKGSHNGGVEGKVSVHLYLIARGGEKNVDELVGKGATMLLMMLSKKTQTRHLGGEYSACILPLEQTQQAPPIATEGLNPCAKLEHM